MPWVRPGWTALHFACCGGQEGSSRASGLQLDFRVVDLIEVLLTLTSHEQMNNEPLHILSRWVLVTVGNPWAAVYTEQPWRLFAMYTSRIQETDRSKGFNNRNKTPGSPFKYQTLLRALSTLRPSSSVVMQAEMH